MLKIKRKKLAKELIITLLIIIAGFFLIKYYPQWKIVFTDPQKVRAVIESAGAWGPIVLVLLHMIQNVFFFIPGPFISIVGGYTFGVFWGSVYNIIGTMTGSCILFFLARKLGREYAEKRAGKNRAAHFNKLFAKYEKVAIFYSRVMPIFSGPIVTMLASLTRISFKNFFVYSLLGFIPRIFIMNLYGDELTKGITLTIIILTIILILMLVVSIFQERIRNFFIEEERKLFSFIKRTEKAKKK